MTHDGTLYSDTLLRVRYSPGYRDVSIRVRDQLKKEHEINLSAADALSLWIQIGHGLELAWRGDGPIDKKPGETRPGELPVS